MQQLVPHRVAAGDVHQSGTQSTVVASNIGAIDSARHVCPHMRADLTPSLLPPKNAPTHMSASDRIRYRLVHAAHRYHANDNIAAFIRKGELDELRGEVERKLQDVLHALVIDTENDHNTVDTARRVAKMFVNEVFSGRYEAAPSVTEFPNVSGLNDVMVVGPIKVRSACSHHLCPIIGRAWIGVLPSAQSNLIGLSKYARVCDWVMSRPQIQEEAITQLADELERRVRPEGLAVALEATHFCMHWRGVKDEESQMQNSLMRGAFLKEPALRREFLSLIGDARR